MVLVAAKSASSPPRRQSKTGAVLCPSGTGKQEYGYIEVSQLHRLFYTSIQADGNPTTAPTFLFIRGGPGESSIGSALQVNGPCIMDLVTKRLIKNEFSWTRRVNGIWVDAPVPTGFSIGPVESGWENLIQDLIDFVNEFFKQHPNLNRDVHFVGTSASASMVVEVASRIIKSPSVSINNLVGLMIFSGVVGPQAVYRGCLQMANDRQLLPQKTYDIRVAPGKESTLFKLHAGKIDGFLNTKSVQDALGVSKVWKEISEEVFDVFGEYVAYDTTYQVTNLLDAGLKVSNLDMPDTKHQILP
ncbi:Serine carboxypeptidase, putative [Perkinsus marinus ATCC 50983]|uniref:Serine carboxypeptidase, putative n=1 Tax=Perkinsus marinus (strain ATCC 50983 / TXsc) TaxID=423536 RepID=C5K5P4_PERM5|nr:Serine carboxypeptidase, putative [Perkinsus marinus ATCC 50983]EER20201.1 Serine carboxypeptidase, putative [Perkinsus marinus ATCC 50983]|eukprot:XP_002788405.1 Serine carboxypeptidase, putative [Perkinsus marinus ATCC 50983]